ncbi:MAG: cytidylate kinase family protein, partial [Bacteroidaceae bacterium]|nr:cytidylate kinase family protein [Bacteroidaceae bacterium]
FITADSEDRIRYIMQHDNVDREKAMETIEKGDKRRRQYHDYYATTRWGEARCYDLCVNASHMGQEGTTEFICGYIRKRFGL